MLAGSLVSRCLPGSQRASAVPSAVMGFNCSALSLALALCLLIQVVPWSAAQDYDVTNLQCSFASNGGTRDSISAKLRKPSGFRGAPLFADDRAVDPSTDPQCQIRLDQSDPTDMTYNMLVTDFHRCGVVKVNGAVHVRLWFPQFPGVVMLADQELILMCKPPEPIVTQHKAAGFAGSFSGGARVSGVVEEKPGTLEYEVALYKEAPPKNSTNGQLMKQGDVPIEQAVQIGTKLQLRARINAESVWRYVKLMEVTVSPDPENPHVAGHVYLVKDGCRNRDLATIIPHQPGRYKERPNEVYLDFEAFLLSTLQERSTLWIHSEIKACVVPEDCQPEFCLDLFEPSGHGRRRRDINANNTATVRMQRSLTGPENDSAVDHQFTKFGENIAYTVLMKENECYEATKNREEVCGAFLGVATLLGGLLVIAVLMACYLTSRLHSVSKSRHTPTFEELVRQHKLKYQGPEGLERQYH
ncbi:Hypothetical predicted protein [Cloeon dipterum]|uniref:ZP domain-containing protein n=1 Tax=Cloeon dipterum TaxID=197152 RepID=A0A8S1BYV8_9INSE|nr:Hypothetical predicted protein [Cloeon dipterum]